MTQAKSKRKTDSRRCDLAKIHIAKKQLGMCDDTYREMLYNLAGVLSAAQLDKKGRDKILKHLEHCGFRSYHKSAKKSGMDKPAPIERAAMLSKIGAILADIDKPWSYADGIAKRAYHVDKVRWLQPDQLIKVMQMLIYHQQKLHKDGGSYGD